jgi:Polyketide cyclase / dehydrase and lipid transport
MQQDTGMNRLSVLAAAGLTLATLVTSAAAVEAPKPREYVTVVEQTHVDRATDQVWKKVGGYCDIGTWLKTTCVFTTGTGGVGTNRLIAGRVDEVLVARTTTAYTYAQPMAENIYHGTVEVLPDGTGSKIVYTLVYDVSALTDLAAKAGYTEQKTKFLKGMLATMKRISEAP